MPGESNKEIRLTEIKSERCKFSRTDVTIERQDSKIHRKFYVYVSKMAVHLQDKERRFKKKLNLSMLSSFAYWKHMGINIYMYVFVYLYIYTCMYTNLCIFCYVSFQPLVLCQDGNHYLIRFPKEFEVHSGLLRWIKVHIKGYLRFPHKIKEISFPHLAVLFIKVEKGW